MPESSSQATQRRANWVGLRTLRQHPKVVGETDSGEPIFEVRSVRLLLRPEGSHFHLLTQCSKCGRGVAGSQVFSSADLDRPSNPVICTDCVRKTGVATYRPPEASAPAAPPRAETAAPAAVAAAVTYDDIAPEELAEDWDDRRLAAVEARIEAALTQVSELADVQRSESMERRRADEATQSQLQQALHQYISEVRAELTATAPDDDSRANLGALADALQAQRADVARLSAALSESREQIQRLTEANDQLARDHAELQARVGERDAAVQGETAAPTEDVVEAIVERRLRETQAALTEDVVEAIVGRRLQETQAALAEPFGARLVALDSAMAGALAQLRSELAASDQRLDDAVVALTVQRSDVDIAGLARAVGELADARAGVEARFDELAARGQEMQATIDALASAASAGAARLEALEERTEQAVSRLTASIEAQRREFESAMDADRPASRPHVAVPTNSDLLGDLERQLQRAEGRLARLSMAGGNGDVD